MVYGLSCLAFAQLVPPEPPTAKNEVSIVLLDGGTIDGYVRALDEDDGELRFVVVDSAGHKRRVRWSEIAELHQTLEVERLTRAASEQLAADGVERQRWMRVAVPEAGRTELLPLLNPGFDVLIRVYPDPLASLRAGRHATLSRAVTSGSGGVVSGLMAISSGSLLALPRGESEPLVVVGGNYAEQWDRLFGGCDALQRPEVPRYEAFADDLRAHEAACKGP